MNITTTRRSASSSGLCPPLTIAVDVLAWLRATHPELIETVAFR